MDKSKWKAPSTDSLKTAYANRGKYPESSSRKNIFTPVGEDLLWKVSDKSHKVRLLPVHPDDNINFYGMTVHIHTNVGVNGDQYLCPKRMLNKLCPICEQQASLWDTEPDMAKDLYPQSRYLVWMVDLSVEPNKQKTQVWSCPRTAMDDILGISYKKATDEIVNLANLVDGFALYFDREKTPGTTFSKYKNFQLDDNPTPVKEEWVNGIKSFSEIIEYASYDEIKNAFLGLESTVSEEKVVSVRENILVGFSAGRANSRANTGIVENDKTITTEKAMGFENAKCGEYSLPPSTGKDNVLIGEKHISTDDMDRAELEILASTVLLEDYEESEIEEMGTKKLRRLVKEAVDKKTTTEISDVKETTVDPREALKQKLRERVK